MPASGDQLLKRIERRARVQRLERLFVLTTRTAHWFRERGFSEIGPRPCRGRSANSTTSSVARGVRQAAMSACPAPGKAEDAELLAEIALGVRARGDLPAAGSRCAGSAPRSRRSPASRRRIASRRPTLRTPGVRGRSRVLPQDGAAGGVEESRPGLRAAPARASGWRAVWVQTHWRPRADGGLRLSAEHIQARKETEFTCSKPWPSCVARRRQANSTSCAATTSASAWLRC